MQLTLSQFSLISCNEHLFILINTVILYPIHVYLLCALNYIKATYQGLIMAQSAEPILWGRGLPEEIFCVPQSLLFQEG